MTKLALVQLALMMLLVGDVEGQELDRRARERAMLYEPIIASAAQRHELDPRLLWTIAYLESRFRPEAISYKNGTPCARGLMQFVPATARQYDLRNPHDAREAIDAAARYVRDLYERFGGNTELVLAAYNAGEGTVEAFREGRRLLLPNGKIVNPNALRTGGIPPYLETRDYVSRGRFVYEQISHKQLYVSATQSAEGSLLSAVNPDGNEAEASIYSSGSNQVMEAKDKPHKIKTNQSVYPN